jgi:hypothetical protein
VVRVANRLLLALAAATVLAAGATLLLATKPDPSLGEAGAYPVSIVSPDGAIWWNGTVAVGTGATPLGALEAAAAQGRFPIEVEPHALGAYVRGIGPFTETATGGWNYCIDSQWVGLAADARPLRAGERVEWRWVEDGVEVCA